MLEAAAAVLVRVGRRLHDAVERDVVDDLDRAHAGTTRLTENDAPCGSASTAVRPTAVLRGFEHGAAEPLGAPRSGVNVVDPEADVPQRRLARQADGDEVARHRLRRLAADEARQPQQRDRGEPVGLPAEDAVVKGVALDVGRRKRAHRPRARLVDDLGAAMGAGLEDGEDGAGGVREDGGAANAGEVDGAGRAAAGAVARSAVSPRSRPRSFVRHAASSPGTKPATSRPRSVQTRWSPRARVSQARRARRRSRRLRRRRVGARDPRGDAVLVAVAFDSCQLLGRP